MTEPKVVCAEIISNFHHCFISASFVSSCALEQHSPGILLFRYKDSLVFLFIIPHPYYGLSSLVFTCFLYLVHTWISIDFPSCQPNLKSQNLSHSLLMPLIALLHRPSITWHIFLSSPHIRMCYLRTKGCENWCSADSWSLMLNPQAGWIFSCISDGKKGVQSLSLSSRHLSHP